MFNCKLKEFSLGATQIPCELYVLFINKVLVTPRIGQYGRCAVVAKGSVENTPGKAIPLPWSN